MVVFLWLFVWMGTDAVAGIIFQDDFDSYVDSPKNNGWSSIGSQVSTPSSEGRNGSRALKVTYIKEGTAPYVVQKSLNGLNLQEVYVRFYFRVDNPSGGCKFLKFFGKRDSPKGWANTTFALNYNSNTLYELSYGNGAGTINDTQNIIRYGTQVKNYGFDPLVKVSVSEGTFNPKDGQWHCFEAFMRYNSNGQRDGAYRVWIDGKLRVEATNVKNRNDQNSLYFGSFRLADYTSKYFNHTWNIWYDDVVVSTSRIGTDGESVSLPDPISGPNMVSGFQLF